MFSITVNPPNPLNFSSPFLSSGQRSNVTRSLSNTKTFSISALIIPPSSSSSRTPPPPPQNVYQPFRPPPSPLPPKFRNLDANARLEILTNRLAAWFEYAPLIPSLLQEGFTSDILEEITGITGIEQNRLVVAAKVRETLVELNVDPQVLGFFDNGGAELLYEIRSLSNQQRAAAAKYFVEREFDGKKTGELAKAIKDFPKRRGDKGWESFDGLLPGDCLAFMYYRQAQEHFIVSSEEQRKAALQRAMEVVESESGRLRVLEDIEGKKDGAKDAESEVEEIVRVPVVRMMVGEVAEANVVVIFPVCKAGESEVSVEDAPWECGTKGEFGVMEAEKGWARWVVLPGWEPVAGLRRGGVVVEYKDARVLPWRVNRWSKEEPILVIADRGRKEVAADDGFYLVPGGDVGLKVERGLALKESGVTESSGTVVLVVRPPKEKDDYQLIDDDIEDWE
ncbi:hypothetical protein Leryth_007479 [Lithospermum erythrorhizon]|nr:hypothetical protein Leryth_007479 [Lithospermum erythrorhizon]